MRTLDFKGRGGVLSKQIYSLEYYYEDSKNVTRHSPPVSYSVGIKCFS